MDLMEPQGIYQYCKNSMPLIYCKIMWYFKECDKMSKRTFLEFETGGYTKGSLSVLERQLR